MAGTSARGWFANGLHRNFSYTDVNVDGVERIVEATAKYDIDRFVHVSSYNADKNSPSEYFATKVGSSVSNMGNRGWLAKRKCRDGERNWFARSTPRLRLSVLRPCSDSKTTCCTSLPVSRTSSRPTTCRSDSGQFMYSFLPLFLERKKERKKLTG